MSEFLPPNSTPYPDLIAAVQAMLNVVISISALIAVVMLVKAGFEYILSRGDADKAEKATKGIIYALVGLIIVFIAPMIVKFVLTSLLGQLS